MYTMALNYVHTYMYMIFIAKCAIGGSLSLPLRCHGCRFTRNHCECAPMLHISGLSEGCSVANEIDYA